MFDATFDTYWEGPEYESYEPTRDAARFDHAVAPQQGESLDTPLLFLDVEPWPHQREMLEKLAVERERHHRFKNLVVAATGTGKTDLCEGLNGRKHVPPLVGPVAVHVSWPRWTTSACAISSEIYAELGEITRPKDLAERAEALLQDFLSMRDEERTGPRSAFRVDDGSFGNTQHGDTVWTPPGLSGILSDMRAPSHSVVTGFP